MWNDINKIEPNKEYCRCEVITDRGRTVQVDYYDEFGIFTDDDDNELGWKDNGEKPELVIKWREVK